MARQLSEFVSTGDVLPAIQDAFNNSTVKLTLQVANPIARDVVKRVAQSKFKDTVRERVQNIYDGHCMMHGEPEPSWRTFELASWLEPMEAMLEDMFDNDKELSSITSANFRGTIDALAPRNQDEVDRLIQRFADDAWACLTHHTDRTNPDEFGTEKTAAQVLSSVGITSPDIQSLIPAQPAVQQPEGITMYDENTLARELGDGADMMGVRENVKALTDLADNASDDDEIISQSAFQALGTDWSTEKHQALIMQRMVVDVPGIVKAIQFGAFGATDGTPVAGAQVSGSAEAPAQPATSAQGVETVAEVPKRSRKKDTAKTAPDDPTQLVPQSVIETLKDFTGKKAEDLGLGLGISRSTFLNFAAGKAKLYINAQNKAYITNLLNEHINRLTAAKMIVDNLQVPGV